MTSSTGTIIESYIDWMNNEINKKKYGEVSLKVKICNNQIVGVEKMSIDNDKFELKLKGA
jgi:hypothetical protein